MEIERQSLTLVGEPQGLANWDILFAIGLIWIIPAIAGSR